ncbi:hypothetical protein H0H81_004548, partial [Sphagnurus paluster]
TPDPLLEQEPDYEGDQFNAQRQVLINAGIPQENVTQAIQQLWIEDRQKRHEVWKRDRAEGRAGGQRGGEGGDEEPEIHQQADEDRAAQAIDRNTIKKSTKQPTFARGAPVPNDETLHPSEYARQKVVDFKWCELWYFDREGCLEAAQPTASTASDTYRLVAGDIDSIQIRPISSTKASRNAVPDASLTWEQINFASKIMVQTMGEEKWPEPGIRQVVDFYVRLKYKRTKRKHASDTAIIEYQATVRREWFDALGTDREFDLALFSAERMQEIQSRLTIEKHDKAIVSHLHSSNSRMQAHQQPSPLLPYLKPPLSSPIPSHIAPHDTLDAQ